MFLEKITLKPTRLRIKKAKAETRAGEAAGLLAVRGSSVEEACLHAPTQLRAHARTHARTHDTNTKQNQNQFPGWGSTALIIPPNLRDIWLMGPMWNMAKWTQPPGRLNPDSLPLIALYILIYFTIFLCIPMYCLWFPIYSYIFLCIPIYFLLIPVYSYIYIYMTYGPNVEHG